MPASAFQSQAVFDAVNGASPSAKEAAIQKVKGVFQFQIKSKEGTVQTWTLDLKTEGKATLVPAEGDAAAGSSKPDIVVQVADGDFVDLASGKGNAQKMFMSGKIKVKGNVMLATKLDAALKELMPKAKL